MLDFLHELTWPGAVAILGSVIAVVTGLLALFSDYFQSRPKEDQPKAESHDRLLMMENELKILNVKLENLSHHFEDYETRDADESRAIHEKIDKVMAIIVEMLKDK